jgi:hypothetical protein
MTTTTFDELKRPIESVCVKEDLPSKDLVQIATLITEANLQEFDDHVVSWLAHSSAKRQVALKHTYDLIKVHDLYRSVSTSRRLALPTGDTHFIIGITQFAPGNAITYCNVC